jgi:hypothetical protein
MIVLQIQQQSTLLIIKEFERKKQQNGKALFRLKQQKVFLVKTSKKILGHPVTPTLPKH